MLCLECRNVDKQREADLLKKLRMPHAYKCTCRKLKAGERAYDTLNHNCDHKQKCLLSPGWYGDRRWDGSNVGVTLADLKWLHTRKSKR